MASPENDTEEWRTIPGHPEYEVSSLGRVRSYKKCGPDGIPRIASGKPDPTGYPRAALDGKVYYIHGLVALAWHGPRPDGMQVDHVNHHRDDNRPENLTYVTAKDNRARTRARARPTHCKRGHEWTEENTYIYPSSGERICKTCRRLAMAQRMSTDCYCGRALPKRIKVRDGYRNADGDLPVPETPTTTEEWRAIRGQPDYEVSNHGRIRSFRSGRGDRANVVPRILKGTVDYAGYQRITFSSQERRHVHHVVAEAFIGPRLPGYEVAHKNHIRHDNCAENLQYSTRQENLAERYGEPPATCAFGHPMAGENLYVEKRGHRVCKTCRRRRLAKRDPNNCSQCGEPLPDSLKPLPRSASE